jgi:geranylgeranyl pyrophosphate synthase
MSIGIELTQPSRLTVEPLTALLRDVSDAPPGVPARLWKSALTGPLTEFLGRPGKRFRSRLVELTWSLAGRHDAPPPSLPLLVELLHAGSLVVDDIEDGSVQRRGRAALHRMVGLPIALNVGNWLYFWPLTLLRASNLPAAVELDLHRSMVDAVRRCHEGQALDLAARIGDLHPSEVPALVRLISAWKTGSLMALAAGLGAAAGGGAPDLVEAVSTFGERVGVGLQMQNDVSELTGAAGPIKHPEDLIHGRVTWPWAWASERLPAGAFDALQVRGARLSDGAGDAARLANDLRDALGPDPRRPVREWLSAAFDDLQADVGPHPALEKMKAELVRLETRYA